MLDLKIGGFASVARCYSGDIRNGLGLSVGKSYVVEGFKVLGDGGLQAEGEQADDGLWSYVMLRNDSGEVRPYNVYLFHEVEDRLDLGDFGSKEFSKPGLVRGSKGCA